MVKGLKRGVYLYHFADDVATTHLTLSPIHVVVAVVAVSLLISEEVWSSYRGGVVTIWGRCGHHAGRCGHHVGEVWSPYGGGVVTHLVMYSVLRRF